jgi:4-hydroxy-4-methyl-2-oxoglutarate aldolase
MTNKTLLGKIDPVKVRVLEKPRADDAVLDGFRRLGEDATSIISDVLDEMSIVGALAASEFRPTMPGSMIVGRALTVRNEMAGVSPHDAARQHVNSMAEIEAHNLAEPDDVLVIQGVPGISNMGGISSQIAKRQGELGAIVEGSVRDVGHSRRVGYPMWSTGVTPITGKWRIETVEINGAVRLRDVVVHPGDIVIADDSGVCIVPLAQATEVLARSLARQRAEEHRCTAIDAGVAIRDLPKPA